MATAFKQFPTMITRAAKLFKPAFYQKELSQIDQSAHSYTLDRADTLKRVGFVTLVACLSLFVIHYLKSGKVFIGFFSLFFEDFRVVYHSAYYAELGFYVWWTFWQVLGYIIIPLVALRLFYKEQHWYLGLQWSDTGKHARYYLALTLPILVFVLIASRSDSFSEHYPFYSDAKRSVLDFVAWEFLYILQFFALEFFFRGFIVEGLRPAIGANAIWFMMLPYLMIHFPKLWPEAFGAIMFGFLLGLLALKSRSIWGGFLVHISIALAMDVLAL